MTNTLAVTTDELMIVNAARALGKLAATGRAVCFVGIGLPSTAANLARQIYSPAPILIYESGCIGSKPTRLPLSIGDGELADTSDSVVSVPEIFAYWLQSGKVDVGFLGGAQIDKFGNINSTVIGSYDAPKTRLPGAGGAPEIAASAGQVMVIMRQTKRAFVERCDFRTSFGFGDGKGHRQRIGLRGGGPKMVITDLGILEPDPETCELVQTYLHPGVTPVQCKESTNWQLRINSEIGSTKEVDQLEIDALRKLQAAS